MLTERLPEAAEQPPAALEASASEDPPETAFAYVHVQLGESAVIEAELCTGKPAVNRSHLFSVAGRGLCLVVIDQIGLVPPSSACALQMDEFTIGADGQVIECEPALRDPSDEPCPRSDGRSSC